MKKRRTAVCGMAALTLVLLAGCGKAEVQTEQPVVDVMQTEQTEAPVIDVTQKEQPEEKTVPEGADAEGAAANLPRIVCWGDSLTEGTGGEGMTYPNTLEKLSGREVKNYGVYAEMASCIAARQGGNPMHVDAAFTIPAACEPVEIKPVNKSGSPEMLLVFGDAGINPCSIGGVMGTMSINADNGVRYFTRSEAGEETAVESGTPILFHAMLDKREDDILVIFSGTNDYPDTESIKGVIAYQRAMLKYAGAEDYVIIGMTKKKAMEEIEEINQILAAEYGEHFLDIRTYLMEHGLEDAGVAETAQDRADMEAGEIPASLRTDEEGHGTSAFYRIIGEQLYKKMQELGYLH